MPTKEEVAAIVRQAVAEAEIEQNGQSVLRKAVNEITRRAYEEKINMHAVFRARNVKLYSYNE